MYKIKIYSEIGKQKNKITKLNYADNYIKRLIGLIGKKKFKGLLFKQKYPNRFFGSIHTCLMKETIDVVYINRKMKIQELTTLKPWKLYIPKNGNIKYIIELPEKSITKNNIKKGDKILIEEE